MSMRYHWENLPPSLSERRGVLREIVEALSRARRLRQVIVFGSHARGEAGPDSDVDLCLLAEGAEDQIKAAIQFRHELRGIPDRPPLTLLPISPARWQEKHAAHDPFFDTVRREGRTLATSD